MSAPIPLTYPALYAFFRERAEAGPDPLAGEPDLAAHDRRPDTGREAWVQYLDEAVSRRPFYRRMYRTDCGFARVFNPLTLFHSGYRHAAPVNTVMFAGTGIDGVHYNFVTDANGRWSPQSPVIVTAPTCGGTLGNLVLALDLREFLCLGLRAGFDRLDMLIGDPDGFIDVYPAGDQVGDLRPHEQAELSALAERFGLVPWEKDAIRPRLAELDRMIRPRLVFPDAHA